MCKDDIPTLSNLTLTFENISKLALEVGFDACGVAPIHRLDDDAQFMDNWIAQGLHGEMDYLTRNCDKRYDPSLLVPGAQTVVVCLLTFEHSGRDYHRKVKSMLYCMFNTVNFSLQIHRSPIFQCDSIPGHSTSLCTKLSL